MTLQMQVEKTKSYDKIYNELECSEEDVLHALKEHKIEEDPEWKEFVASITVKAKEAGLV